MTTHQNNLRGINIYIKSINTAPVEDKALRPPPVRSVRFNHRTRQSEQCVSQSVHRIFIKPA